MRRKRGTQITKMTSLKSGIQNLQCQDRFLRDQYQENQIHLLFQILPPILYTRKKKIQIIIKNLYKSPMSKARNQIRKIPLLKSPPKNKQGLKLAYKSTMLTNQLTFNTKSQVDIQIGVLCFQNLEFCLNLQICKSPK